MENVFTSSINSLSPLKSPIKTRFEQELEKEIEVYLSKLPPEAIYPTNQLLSPSLRRAKMKEELLAAHELPALTNYIEVACQLLVSEGAQSNSAEDYQTMIIDLARINRRIQKIHPETFHARDLPKLLAVSPKTLEITFATAISKFDAAKYGDSVALLALLTVFQPQNFDYWYRLAIAAHYNQNYPLAIRAYAIAAQCNPSEIGCHLFAAECRIANREIVEAQMECQEAKKLIELNHAEDSWNDLLTHVEKLAHVA